MTESSRRILTSYFLDFAMGGLTRENLAQVVPYPLLLTLSEIKDLDTTDAMISGTIRIDNTDLVTVYKPQSVSDRGHGEGLYVGRSKGLELTLNDPQISRSHALIHQCGVSWFISDLGSKNGTSLYDIHANKRIKVARHPGKTELGTSAFMTFGGHWYRFLTPERFYAHLKRKSKEYAERLSNETSDGLDIKRFRS